MKRRVDVLVTGGGGFIGSEVTRRLLAMGTRITVLDNFSFGRKDHIWPGIRCITGDIRAAASLRRAVDRRYDAVFHLAALHFIPYCDTHPAETVDVNVNGTLSLLERLEKQRPRRLFFASTAAVYGPTRRRHREDNLPDPVDIYGITKLAGEHLIRQFHRTTGVSCAIGRLFNAYGPRETNPHLIPRIIEQLRGGARTLTLGNLSPYRDYIHVTDMAEAIIGMNYVQKKDLLLANIASGSEHSVRDVARQCARHLGDRIRVRSAKRLRRPVDRSHLRAETSVLKRVLRFHARTALSEGIRDLLITEGILVP